MQCRGGGREGGEASVREGGWGSGDQAMTPNQTTVSLAKEPQLLTQLLHSSCGEPQRSPKKMIIIDEKYEVVNIIFM